MGSEPAVSETVNQGAMDDDTIVAIPELAPENYIDPDSFNIEDREVVNDDGVFWFSETSISSKMNININSLVPFDNVELISINTYDEIIDVYNALGIYMGYLKGETRTYSCTCFSRACTSPGSRYDTK